MHTMTVMDDSLPRLYKSLDDVENAGRIIGRGREGSIALDMILTVACKLTAVRYKVKRAHPSDPNSPVLAPRPEISVSYCNP